MWKLFHLQGLKTQFVKDDNIGHTNTPYPLPPLSPPWQTWGLPSSPLLLLTSGSHYWRPVQTCSLEDLPSPHWYSHLVVATERAVRILLECCLFFCLIRKQWRRNTCQISTFYHEATNTRQLPNSQKADDQLKWSTSIFHFPHTPFKSETKGSRPRELKRVFVAQSSPFLFLNRTSSFTM